MPASELSIGHRDQSPPLVSQQGEGVSQHEHADTLRHVDVRDIGDVAVKFTMSEWQGASDAAVSRATFDEDSVTDHESTPLSLVRQMTRQLQMQRDEFGRRYAAMASDDRSTAQYDGWHQMNYTEVLADTDAEPSQLAELIQELRYSADYEASIKGGEANLNYGDVLSIINQVPEESLRGMYLSNKDAESGALRYLLGQVVGADAQPAYPLSQSLELLQKIYHEDDALELMASHTEDKLINALGGRSDYARIMLNAMPSVNHNFSRDRQDLSAAQRDWSERYLKECLTLPESLVDDYQFASFSRLSDFEEGRPTSLVSESKLYDSMSRIEYTTREVSSEKLMYLREKAGIVNIDNYTPKQLNDTYRFVSGDPEYIEKLQAGDMTLVLSDAKGDWNGATASTPRVLDNQAANALFFEINQQSDPYRAFAMCRRADVRPSRVVIGAHGSPGNMWFGNKSDANNFVISNQLPSVGLEAGALHGQVVMPLMGAESLTRIADEYMQDSRGINDSQELIGRRQIILKSCSQSAPREVVRMMNGEQSIVQESTAETFAKIIGHTSVDIYAAAAPVSSSATATGITFRGGDERDIFPASKMTIDEYGQVVTTTVDEIVLWHDNNKQEVA